jgi:hypothetical protein
MAPRRILTVTLLVLALVTLWQFWPSDERRIQQLVQDMAGALQHVTGETDLARLGRVAPLARGLASNVVVEGPWLARGRDQAMTAARQLEREAPQLSIVVRSIDVTVDPARTAATAVVTVAITGVTSRNSGNWNDVSELQLDLTRHDDVWLITRVAPVAALHK